MKFNNNTKKTLLLAMMFASMMNSTAFASSFSDINNVQGRDTLKNLQKKAILQAMKTAHLSQTIL